MVCTSCLFLHAKKNLIFFSFSSFISTAYVKEVTGGSDVHTAIDCVRESMPGASDRCTGQPSIGCTTPIRLGRRRTAAAGYSLGADV